MKNVLYRCLSAIGFVLLISNVQSAPLPAGRPKERVTFKAHTHEVWDIAFSPDGKTLATAGCNDGTTKLWDAVSGKQLATFKGHEVDPKKCAHGYVLAVAFSPDGRTLATAGDDMTARLWDIVSGKSVAVLRHRAGCAQLAFSPDGKTLAVDGLTLWDLETKQAKPSFKGVGGLYQAMAFDPKGRLLIANACPLPELLDFALWNGEKAEKVMIFKGHTKSVMHIAFRQDGKMAASCAWDHTIRLWDVASGKNIATFPEMKDLAGNLAFSPDGTILAVSSIPKADRNDYPGTVRLFAVPDGKLLATLNGHRRSVRRMVFSPDGQLLATGGFDQMVKLWSLPSHYKSEE